MNSLGILLKTFWSDNLIILSLGCYNGTLDISCKQHAGIHNRLIRSEFDCQRWQILFSIFFVAVPSLSDLMCHCAKEQTPGANECMNMRIFFWKETLDCRYFRIVYWCANNLQCYWDAKSFYGITKTITLLERYSLEYKLRLMRLNWKEQFCLSYLLMFCNSIWRKKHPSSQKRRYIITRVAKFWIVVFW